LNEILLENKNIEIINLASKLSIIIKGTKIKSKGLIYLKESLKKNQFLKKINLGGK
jgi:hypothetical protein